jgi:hypothetical protein
MDPKIICIKNMGKPMEKLGSQFFDSSWWRHNPDGTYQAKCQYIKGTEGECPNNEDGWCLTIHSEIPKNLCHFPDKNNWKCPCG